MTADNQFHDIPVVQDGIPLLCSGEYYPYLPATKKAPAEEEILELTSVNLAGFDILTLLSDAALWDLSQEVLKKLEGEV